MSKIITVIFSSLFLISAYLQLNDLDPMLWTSFYVFMALLPLTSYIKKYKNKILIASLFVVGMWFGSFIDDLYYWAQEGFPSIVGSMKAGTESVELVREAGGLFICCLAIIFYMKNKDDLKSKTA